MCYSPVKIWNNSLHYNRYKPVQFQVRCNHCEACLDSRRIDWYIRSYFEYKKVLDDNGLAVVYTLTYDPEHVNMFHGRTAFRSSDFQKFVKRLRSFLSDHFPSWSFKYLSCPEYGDLYQRPHYHVLFFISDSQGFKPSSRLFYNSVKSCWQQGFIHVKKGTNYGIVQSFKALRYVTKYITKSELNYDTFWIHYAIARQVYQRALSEHAFEDIPSISEIRSYSPEKLHHDDSISPYIRLYSRLVSDLSPCVHASNAFGSSALQYLTPSDIDSESCLVPFGNSYESIRLPLYIQRKLFYTTIPNERDGKPTRFILTEKGLDHRLATLERKIDVLAENWRSSLSSDISSYFFSIKSKLFWLPFDNSKDFISYLCDNFDDIRRAAIYNICYKGTILPQWMIDSNNFFHNQIYSYNYYAKLHFYERPEQPSLSDHPDRSRFLGDFNLTANIFEHYHLLSDCFSALYAELLRSRKLAAKANSSLVKKRNDFLKHDFYEKTIFGHD